MSVTVEINFDLKRIDLDFSKELNRAGEIIRRDHFQRLEKGKDVSGSQMRGLKPATIASKSKSKDGRISANANKILVGTGQMRNLRKKDATKERQTTELWVGRDKKHGSISPKGYPKSQVTPVEAGVYHQDGGREWFGISKDALQRCTEIMEKKIGQEIRRA